MQVYKDYLPEVSIIMPTFNRKNYVKRSIDSVIMQSFRNWELIIVDDGSTDSSNLLIDDYIFKHTNIRYLKHSNRKPPLSTNAGILASVGHFITFIGSDDEYKEDHLKLRYDLMVRNNSLDIIHGGFKVVGHPYVKDKNDLSKEIHLSECVIGGTFFGKRNVFIELNGFQNLAYSDDSDFLERAMIRYNVLKVEYPTYIYYRDIPDSICNTIK
ncbi:MAG: glycosyltransferase family 2 protein [Ignavibacteria bacterium]|nr:glycosyltransferase family 2 protein [Ignavibacteria bacterium]